MAFERWSFSGKSGFKHDHWFDVGYWKLSFSVRPHERADRCLLPRLDPGCRG
jgi:hypothetical protein